MHKNLIASLETEGYVFRRDGIILGKDGFKIPDYLARDPAYVDLECPPLWTGKQRYAGAWLIAKKYIPIPEGSDVEEDKLVVKHINGLVGDNSVENLKWEEPTSGKH